MTHSEQRESDAIDVATKSGKFVLQIYGLDLGVYIIRGYLKGWLGLLVAVIGPKDAAEFCYRLADGVVAAGNIPGLMQSCHDDVVKAAKAK